MSKHLHDLGVILQFHGVGTLNFYAPCFSKDIGSVLGWENGQE